MSRKTVALLFAAALGLAAFVATARWHVSSRGESVADDLLATSVTDGGARAATPRASLDDAGNPLGLRDAALTSPGRSETAPAALESAAKEGDLPGVRGWVSRKRVPNALACCSDGQLNPRNLKLSEGELVELDSIVDAGNKRIDEVGDLLSAHMRTVVDAKRRAGYETLIGPEDRLSHSTGSFVEVVGTGSANGLRMSYVEVVPGENLEIDSLMREIRDLNASNRATVSLYIDRYGEP